MAKQSSVIGCDTKNWTSEDCMSSGTRPAASGSQPIIQLNMTARGKPWAEGREGLVSFFRLAHEWIVNGFAAVTTDEAQHELWGKIT